MPEQLTKHPEVTLTVLRSGGASCAEGAKQEILTQCPKERFCKLPGGEVCVYGLPEAARMTQVTAADWKAHLQVVVPPTPEAPDPGGTGIAVSGAVGLVAGVLLGIAWARHRRREPRP